MRSGIYALASLDGGPIFTDDVNRLELTPPLSSHTADGVPETSGFAQAPGVLVRAHDAQAAAICVHHSVAALNVLAGYLDEPDDLSRTLGMPLGTPAAALAEAALLRYGTDAPLHLLGEWSLLRWDPVARTLTLVTSEALRDALYFAVGGARAAVAPDMLRLCSLRWVGRQLDPVGFALGVARARLRGTMGTRTPWEGVHRVEPGATVVLREGGTVVTPHRWHGEQPERWRGSFDDAVEATDHMLERIVSQQLKRAGVAAGFLSGGIDSSLLTALAARVAGARPAFFSVSSVAGTGSGLADERAYIQAVATQTGVATHFVVPPADADAYRPAPEWFELLQHPVPGLRHYLYRELLGVAAANGATAVLDGAFGEHSITRKPALGSHLSALRRWRFNYLLRRHDQRVLEDGLQSGFHVRLAPSLLQQLPQDWEGIATQKPDKPPALRKREAIGLDPVVRRAAALDTGALFGLRQVYPYRDQRLLRLAARFPAGFHTYENGTRAIARAVLREKVPDQVRLRRDSMPFSPDYVQRLQAQAPQALKRMPQFRAAGLGEWLDLDWLEHALQEIASRAPDTTLAAQTQMTAITAEFFMWLPK